MSNHGVCHFRETLASPSGSFGTSAHPTPTDVMLQQHIQAEVSAAISDALRDRHSPSRRHHPQSLERETGHIDNGMMSIGLNIWETQIDIMMMIMKIPTMIKLVGNLMHGPPDLSAPLLHLILIKKMMDSKQINLMMLLQKGMW